MAVDHQHLRQPMFYLLNGLTELCLGTSRLELLQNIGFCPKLFGNLGDLCNDSAFLIFHYPPVVRKSAYAQSTIFGATAFKEDFSVWPNQCDYPGGCMWPESWEFTHFQSYTIAGALSALFNNNGVCFLISLTIPAGVLQKLEREFVFLNKNYVLCASEEPWA